MSDANSLANTANRLSLAAAILAASAFIVSLLQALLEYSSSGNQRDKCNSCAIHIAKGMASRHWDVFGWKWRYFYPELDLRARSIFQQLLDDRPISIEGSFLREIGQSKGHGFRALNPDNVPSSNWLHDGLTVLSTLKQPAAGNKHANEHSLDNISRAMTTKDLTLSQYFKWRWWLFRYPQQPMIFIAVGVLMVVLIFPLNFAPGFIGLIRAALWKFDRFDELVHHEVNLRGSLVIEVEL